MLFIQKLSLLFEKIKKGLISHWFVLNDIYKVLNKQIKNINSKLNVKNLYIILIIKYKININVLNITKNIQIINLQKYFNKLVGLK